MLKTVNMIAGWCVQMT